MGNLDRLVRNKDAGIAFSALLLFVGFSLSSESVLSGYNLFNISRIIAFSAFVALAQAARAWGKHQEMLGPRAQCI